MNENTLIVVFLASAMATLVGLSVIGTSYYAKQNEQDQRSVQACIASQRTAQDCALILHGTGSR